MVCCAFHGHAQRVGVCEGRASSFFKTHKGTLWPLCGACADRHKKLVLKVAQSGGLDAENAARATFDIPLNDPEALMDFLAQDPEKIWRVIKEVDDLS